MKTKSAIKAKAGTERAQGAKLPVLNLEIIRSWGPCYDPGKWAPTDWSGTIVDILKAKQIPVDDRIWAATRQGSGIDDKTLRLFACWCAREAFKLPSVKYKIDPRSVAAVDVAERFALGKASERELAAARDAARAAARAAAWDAARAAAWDAARAAARDAARAAAWDAAWDAARDAAWAAARDAARAAAWDAARDAARDAAWAAAWAAAWDAARDAARDAQVAHLISML